MSRADYDSLTKREKAFILKAYENKLVSDTQHLNNAVANAVSNVFRKKGKNWVHLWKKKPRKSDTEELKLAMEKAQAETDKSWVDKIHNSRSH